MFASNSSSTINSSATAASRLTSSHNHHQPNQIVSQSYKIITQYGDMLVVKQSLQSQQQQQQQQQQNTCSSSSSLISQQAEQQPQLTQRPVIMTFHDIGLNSELQFSNFCECDEVKLMLQTFTMLHVNLIGQEFKSGGGTCPTSSGSRAPCERLPDDFKYPTAEQLAECIVDVCAQLRVRSFIGLAVGAGAHIAGSLALMRPDLVDGLFLINPVFSSCSITEWLYFKMSAIASNQSVHSWAAGPSVASDESPKQSGLRRLLHAAHIHLPAEAREPAPDSPEQRPKQPAGARLRQLIFSRHVGRLTSQQQPMVAQSSTDSRTGSFSSLEGSSPQQQQATVGTNSETGRRPPVEYLMYHHFGPSSARRCSDSSTTPAGLATAGSKGSLSGGSGGSPSSEASPRIRAAARLQRRVGRRDSSTSQEGHRARSGSFCLSASYLASLGSERQRVAHMLAVYKHYFSQLNAHNLWLLAHSFAKRRTLNLRKDCGAAAHAAAAAATLGTSICTAFVGTQASGSGSSPSRETGGAQTARTAPKSSASNSSSSRAAGNQNHSEQQPQVAGTKVKRTFTCQTLIMCSSVQTHCERAFKLMSLLNPLQATWIKTDHLLVLEERPDKVCQALRLFLQGIGYSMSTYERRLRLSSNTGSQSSADSTGSAKSLSGEQAS